MSSELYFSYMLDGKMFTYANILYVNNIATENGLWTDVLIDTSIKGGWGDS